MTLNLIRTLPYLILRRYFPKSKDDIASQFLVYLYPFPIIFYSFFEFHLQHSEDDADCNSFIISVLFSLFAFLISWISISYIMYTQKMTDKFYCIVIQFTN